MPRWGKPVAGRSHPEAFSPELAKLVKAPPAGDGWLHEVKWDGYRIVATVTKVDVRLWSRNGIEWTQKVPELATAVRSLRLKDAQLDGEMIVPTETGSDFNALQGRLGAENKAPLRYVLFDAPRLEGEDLRKLPLIERKGRLEALLKKSRSKLLAYSAHQIGNGAVLFTQAMQAGWEGIISKRVSSPYIYGARNGDWVKVKARLSDEFAVVGYTNPEGSRIGIGALMLASWVDDEWIYVGRVGTGFNDELLRTLAKQLKLQEVKIPTANAALMEAATRRKAHWVKPTIVAEVFHQGLGSQHLLRHPSLKAIRADKTPTSLAAESKRKRGR
jgi:bifunctional non-homologous end joining protein LigD